MADNGPNVPVRRFTAPSNAPQDAVAIEQPQQTEDVAATTPMIEVYLASLMNLNATAMKQAVHTALQVAEPLNIEIDQFKGNHEFMAKIRKDIAIAIFNGAKHDLWKMIDHHSIALGTIQDYVDAVIDKFESDLEKEQE